MLGSKNEISSSCADELLAAISGRVALPGDGFYDEAPACGLVAVRRRPAIVAFCKQPEDVQAAVRATRRHGLPLSVRGGGHDWVGRARATMGSSSTSPGCGMWRWTRERLWPRRGRGPGQGCGRRRRRPWLGRGNGLRTSFWRQTTGLLRSSARRGALLRSGAVLAPPLPETSSV